MDKDEILKRNLLKRLYGEEKTVQDEAKPSPTLNASDNSVFTTAVTKQRIYSASPAPPGYKYISEVTDSVGTSSVNTQETSSEESSDTDDFKPQRKRRRRGHKQRDTHISGEKVSTEADTADSPLGLTKNQKRKLKKKRRKEKLRQENKSLPFSYIDVNEANTQTTCIREDEGKTDKDKVIQLIEFFDAVWDLYKQEGIMKKVLTDDHNMKWNNLMETLQNFMKDSEDDNKELDECVRCICDIKTYLILNHRSKATETLKHLKDNFSTSLDISTKNFVYELMEYWMTSVMPNR